MKKVKTMKQKNFFKKSSENSKLSNKNTNKVFRIFAPFCTVKIDFSKSGILENTAF